MRKASLAVALGAIAFLTADVIEAHYWRWFAGDVPFGPWFLNAGSAVLCTAACVVAGSALAGAIVRGPLEKIRQTIYTAVGACAAMTVVLFIRGPGNIFPIVLVIGGFVLCISAAVGTLASLLVRR